MPMRKAKRRKLNILPAMKGGISEMSLSTSLWFALHRRPNGSPRRGLCSSHEDIAGGIRISVCRMPAVSTVEARLALAVSFVNRAAT